MKKEFFEFTTLYKFCVKNYPRSIWENVDLLFRKIWLSCPGAETNISNDNQNVSSGNYADLLYNSYKNKIANDLNHTTNSTQTKLLVPFVPCRKDYQLFLFPVIEILHQRGIDATIFLSKKDKQNNISPELFPHSNFILADDVSTQEVEKLADDDLQKLNTNINKLSDELGLDDQERIGTINFFRYYFFENELFKRVLEMVSPSLIYGIHYISRPGFIKAIADFKVKNPYLKNVLIQHARIGYGGYHDFRGADLVILWSKEDAERLESKKATNDIPLYEVVGNPKLDFLLSKNREFSIFNDKTFKKVVLFISNDPFGNYVDELEVFAKAVIACSEVVPIYKLHPGENLEHYYPLIKKGLIHLRQIIKFVSMYNLMDIADIVVGVNSSSLDDAVIFKKAVIQINVNKKYESRFTTVVSNKRDLRDQIRRLLYHYEYRATVLNSDMELIDNISQYNNRVNNNIANLLESLLHKTKDVSIVVLTYNSENTIFNCLDSVENNLRLGDEVILVDNGSIDNTLLVINNFIAGKEQFKIVENNTNLGFSAGTNIGIKASKNPYIVLLNPDTIVTQNWLDHLLEHFNENNIAAVGPISNYVAGLQKMEFYQKENFIQNAPLHEIASKFYEWLRGYSVETKLLIGFCMAIRKDVLDKLGLLDEDLFLGNDDLELSWRLRLNGYSLKVAADTFIYHEGQQSFETEEKSKTSALVQESTECLYKKLQRHYGITGVPTPKELWEIGWFTPLSPQFNPGSRLFDVKVKPLNNENVLTNNDELEVPTVSIIVLTFNEIAHTIKCVESIEKHTLLDYELIVVDNGSTDGTRSFLRQYMLPRENVHVLTNVSNRGFAFGNNQGMSIARGKYILLLNNDTIVTKNWLNNMLAVFQKEPKVGIVGPVSNYVSGAQLVSNVNYKTIKQMEDFAYQWSLKHHGENIPAIRVVGFCLLVSMAVINSIGGLDIRYGSGNFEDDDYCIRASNAGFEARIAINSFVHHSGSQTFKGANIDYEQSLLRNWELFKMKWNVPASTPYEKGYKFPIFLSEGESNYISLPDINLDHKTGYYKRWWGEII